MCVCVCVCELSSSSITGISGRKPPLLEPPPPLVKSGQILRSGDFRDLGVFEVRTAGLGRGGGGGGLWEGVFGVRASILEAPATLFPIVKSWFIGPKCFFFRLRRAILPCKILIYRAKMHFFFACGGLSLVKSLFIGPKCQIFSPAAGYSPL